MEFVLVSIAYLLAIISLAIKGSNVDFNALMTGLLGLMSGFFLGRRNGK